MGSPENSGGLGRLRLGRIVEETPGTSSFYLEPVDETPLLPFVAGQYVLVSSQGGEQRKYWISSYSSQPKSYRITVRKPENDGGVSAFLHAAAKGDILEVEGPAGNFTLSTPPLRPIALVSSGIGLAPMVAIAEEIAVKWPSHPLWLFHETVNSLTFALSQRLRSLKHDLTKASIIVNFLKPRSTDRIGLDFNSEGPLDLQNLKSRLALDDQDFYICGPDSFVAGITKVLRHGGVAADRIRTESAGASIDELPAVEHFEPVFDVEQALPRRVKFLKSGVDEIWDISKGTLLDFAEQLEVIAPSSCRTGMCGVCKQRLVQGEVSPIRKTSAQIGADKVLLCSTIPHTDIDLDM